MKRLFSTAIVVLVALAVSLLAPTAMAEMLSLGVVAVGMGNIVVTKAEWDALLQEEYVIGEIVEAVDKSVPFKNRLKRKGMTHGRRRIYPVQVGMSQGQGSRAENSTMPDYGAGEYKDAIVEAKYHYAPFKITGQSEEFTNRKAFVEFGMRAIRDTKEGLTQFTGRQCWGDGSGKLALVNDGAANVGDTTVTVDSAYGVAWGSLAANTTFLFKRNMKIQFGTEDNGGAGYKITSLTGTTITFAPGLVNAVADNAAIYTLKSKDLEIEGWLKIVATSSFMTGELALANDTYHNIDRSDNPEWEGNVINAAAALSLTNIRTAKDTMFKRVNEEFRGLCINSTEVTRDYEALLTPSQRFVPAVKLEAGHTALEHDGVRFTKDAKAPVKAFNLVDVEHIAWAQTRDPHWLKDGDSILRVVAGQDAKEALLKWYANLDCEEPRRQTIMYNLTVT